MSSDPEEWLYGGLLHFNSEESGGRPVVNCAFNIACDNHGGYISIINDMFKDSKHVSVVALRRILRFWNSRRIVEHIKDGPQVLVL